jgi:uncharacterized UBP type Zn finger protein
MDGQVQHDAHELNRLLIDALEKSLKRTSGETLCRRLYEGSCANQIKCMSCQGVSERSEVFYDINLQVIDCPDLCASLRRHCAGEVLAGDSAYQCDTCRGRREALRTTVLRTLPQVSRVVAVQRTVVSVCSFLIPLLMPFLFGACRC